MSSSTGTENQRSAPLPQPPKDNQVSPSNIDQQDQANHASTKDLLRPLPEELKVSIVGFTVLEKRPIRLNLPVDYASNEEEDDYQYTDADYLAMNDLPLDDTDSGRLDDDDRDAVLSLSDQWAEFQIPEWVDLYGPDDSWAGEVRKQYFTANRFTILLMDLTHTLRADEHEGFSVEDVHGRLLALRDEGVRFDSVRGQGTSSARLKIKILDGISDSPIQIREWIELAALLQSLGFSRKKTMLKVGTAITLRDDHGGELLDNNTIARLYEKALCTGFSHDRVAGEAPWFDYFHDGQVVSLVKGGKDTPIFKAMFEQDEEVPESAMQLPQYESSEEDEMSEDWSDSDSDAE